MNNWFFRKDNKKIEAEIEAIKQLLGERFPAVNPELKSSEKLFDVLGGLLEFNRGTLSDEKRISSRLLSANKDWVFRNNDVIANEVSKIEFQLYSLGLKDGKVTYKEIDEHPLLDLLDRFNSTTTREDGIYITQSHKKLTGDAFWLLSRNGKSIKDIFVLPPDKIELKLGDPTDATSNLVEGYIYRDTIDGKNITIEYSRDDIIHFKKPNPKNPFRGYGTIEALADTIDSDNMANVVQSNFFSKGAITNFILSTDHSLTTDQIKRMRAEMRAAYSGASNSWTTMIFGNGLKPEKVGFSNKEMQFLDILEWYRDKIMVGFGNTKASIGIIDDVNRASHESATTGWLRSTVKPDMDAIVNTLNEFLVPLYGKNLVLGYVSPVPEDRADDLAEATQLKNAGIIMVNEARELLGYESVDGGDIFAPQSAGVATPSTPDQAPTTDPENENNPNNDEDKHIRFYRRKSFDRKLGNVPASLAHLDIKHMLRQRSVFTSLQVNRDMKDAAKPIIRELLGKNKKDAPAQTLHSQFTDEQINTYYTKQMHVVDVLEKRFRDAVVRFIGDVENDVLNKLEGETKATKWLVKKQLIDEEKYKIQAQLDFTPLLMQEVVLAGNEAYALVGSGDTYIPYDISTAVSDNVAKFTESMLNTERERIVQILSDGVSSGASVPEMRNSLQAAFNDLKSVQAERIVRTEVLRASNMAAEDAFEQSGVVKAKQWLVGPNACEKCLVYSNKIIGLGKDFYESDNKFENGNPPKHVHCSCVLVPIIIDE